jgi:adenine-specific DNA-methyltransferase
VDASSAGFREGRGLGEPDIALTTGEVRSNDTGQVALWMIDTNYNGDSFFVRHCYFTGGGDPYERLKTALKTARIAVKVINDYGDES